MNAVAQIAIAALVVAAAVNLVRALRPGTVVDRALALDCIASAIISGVAIGAVRADNDALVDVALVGGLLGFLTLAAVARYIGRRGL